VGLRLECRHPDQSIVLHGAAIELPVALRAYVGIGCPGLLNGTHPPGITRSALRRWIELSAPPIDEDRFGREQTMGLAATEVAEVVEVVGPVANVIVESRASAPSGIEVADQFHQLADPWSVLS